MKKLFSLFFTWRLLLFIPLLWAARFIPFRKGYEYTSLLFDYDTPAFFKNILLAPWATFDGRPYLLIAADGYSSNGRFFPLFPILISALSHLGIYPLVAGLFLSNLFFILALIVLYKLLILDKEKRPYEVVLLLLLFPTSFFYASVYSESLFLLLTLLSFYLARQKKWFLASLCGALLTSVRLVGLAILPALIFEYMKEKKRGNKWGFLSFLLVPTGLIIYSLFNKIHFGDPLHFIHAQGELANGRSTTSIVFPLQTVYRYAKILLTVSHTTYDWWVALLELCVFIFASVLFYVAYRKKVRMSYLIFAFFAFLIPILSGTFTGFPRYAIVLFPLFIGFSRLSNKWVKIVYAFIAVILSFLLISAFTRGYYIA